MGAHAVLFRRVVVCACLAGAGAARSESLEAFAPAARGSGFEESFARALEAESPRPLAPGLSSALDAAAQEAAAAGAEAPPARKEHTFWIAAVSVGAVAGSAYNSFSDGPSQSWHFADEGWFGKNTYVGGADKASHFVSYYVVGKLLDGVFQELGAPTDRARFLGAGVSALAGLMTEIGDGTTQFGFSYEDLIVDFLGAGTSLAIAHYGLDDLIGFRAGLVPAPEPVIVEDEGRDYSTEIYTGDLKLEGLACRAKFDPGPLRYLMVSLTYGTKGYPYSDPDVRERQVGIELGINFGAVMRTIGVPQQKWWGKILYFLFDVIRVPYTSIGVQYDLNSREWRGPGIGDSFPDGP